MTREERKGTFFPGSYSEHVGVVGRSREDVHDDRTE